MVLSNNAFEWINECMYIFSIWDEHIYEHCIQDNYQAQENTVRENNTIKRLKDSETFFMCMIVCMYYKKTGTYISRRKLSLYMDKENQKAQDEKNKRFLETLEPLGLLIHNSPSNDPKDRGARFIEPTSRLISFFNNHCSGTK